MHLVCVNQGFLPFLPVHPIIPMRFDILIMNPSVAAKWIQFTCWLLIHVCFSTDSLLAETLDQPVKQFAQKLYNLQYNTTLSYASLDYISVTVGRWCPCVCTPKKSLMYTRSRIPGIDNNSLQQISAAFLQFVRLFICCT